MKNIKRLLPAILLLLALLCSGCGLSAESVMNVIAPTESPAPGADIIFHPVEENVATPLELTYSELVGNFCPFWAFTDGDRLVAKMTQLSLLDSLGDIPVAEITSMENEDESTSFIIRLRDGLTCSDGEPITADDLLFTYYVLLDSDYDGPYTVITLPVRGLPAYWNGMDTDMYAKYVFLYDDIYRGGNYDQDLQDALKEAEDDLKARKLPQDRWINNNEYRAAKKALDAYDAERAEEIRAAIREAWRQDADDLLVYVMDHYTATITLGTPYTLEEVLSSEGRRVACVMHERLFGEFGEDGSFTSLSGRTWDMTEEFPTTEDFFNEMYEAYQGDAEQYWLIEGIGRPNMLAAVENSLIRQWAPQDENWQGGVNTISGIEKLDGRTIRITLEYYEPSMEKTLTDVMIVPMHVYGNGEIFDPENGRFGFERGELRPVRLNAQIALGGGEFVYRETDIRTVYLDPNPTYWKGARDDVPYAVITKK